MSYGESNSPSMGKIIKIALGIVIIIIGFVFSGKMYESVEPDQIAIFKDPLDGELTFYTQPGFYWQNFGTVTFFQKENQFWFNAPQMGHDKADETDRSIQIKFNDFGIGWLSGSVRYTMPLDEASLRDIYQSYGNQSNMEVSLIRPLIEKSVYLTGPLMSSRESSAEKRNDLLDHVGNQAMHGIYKTRAHEEKQIDPLSGEEKTVMITNVELDKGGQPLRQEPSPLERYHIKLYNLSINQIKYNDVVEGQIAKQQQAIQDVQQAIVDARKAEQNAITAEKEGQAAAAKAKWEKEVDKAKEITDAEKRKEVARLDKEAAEFTKQKLILEGQGEAEKKRLVMDADGALEKKLEAYVRSNEAWASALKDYKGAIVPQQVLGGGSSGQNGLLGMQEAINLMLARDLHVSPNATR